MDFIHAMSFTGFKVFLVRWSRGKVWLIYTSANRIGWMLLYAEHSPHALNCMRAASAYLFRSLWLYIARPLARAVICQWQGAKCPSALSMITIATPGMTKQPPSLNLQLNPSTQPCVHLSCDHVKHIRARLAHRQFSQSRRRLGLQLRHWRIKPMIGHLLTMTGSL